ncbi:hypothetical protein V6N12_066901 [Hibiscus sabdariffa]|uniref:Uncharacterized protein n=1 Tax=Hibiscus sabdariffa TaxID=183260 RepID=A0ABR2C9G6_9ROSI
MLTGKAAIQSSGRKYVVDLPRWVLSVMVQAVMTCVTRLLDMRSRTEEVTRMIEEIRPFESEEVTRMIGEIRPSESEPSEDKSKGSDI